MQSGNPNAAIGWFDRAVASRPGADIYHANRAGALLALGQSAAVLSGSPVAIQLERNSAETYQTLGARRERPRLGAERRVVIAHRDALLR
jgi:hypothetical protein